jgi:ATP-dependent DNA helicase RecG
MKNVQTYSLPANESDAIEFKSSFNKEVIETIVAFSNTHGGKIVLGCNDKKKIIGIDVSDESIQKWLNEVKQNTQPAVFPSFDLHTINGKDIVEIQVDEFPLKPVSFKNRYFCRKKNSNHLLSVDEIAEMRFISLNYSFDAFEVDTKFEELDNKALSLFEKRLKESGRYISSGDLKEDFVKLGLINRRKLTRAAQLLFGIHHTAIHIGRFKTRDVIIDDMVVRSPLILAVEEVVNFVKRNIMLSYEFTGELKREERWQFPLQAIRELLLNAVVHKDYTNPTDVIIKIFDNSIEITNSGRLMRGLTIEDLQTDHYKAQHRNKLLTEAFYLTGDIEKYGTGFIRLRKWLQDYPGVKYRFTDCDGILQMELVMAKDNTIENVVDTGTENNEKTVEKTVEKIIKAIHDNSKITTNELVELTGLTRRGIEWNIAKLKAKGLIERVGANKDGYWKFIKQK